MLEVPYLARIWLSTERQSRKRERASERLLLLLLAMIRSLYYSEFSRRYFHIRQSIANQSRGADDVRVYSHKVDVW